MQPWRLDLGLEQSHIYDDMRMDQDPDFAIILQVKWSNIES